MESSDKNRKSRRKFLQQAGKVVLYAPPAIVLLTRPGFAQINGSLVGRPPSVVANPPGQPAPGGDPRNPPR